MALSSSTVWEVRTAGDDNNGGAFVDGASGTDYSQQNAAQKSGSDLAIHASDSTKVQPVAAGVAAADIGNIIQITAGTGFTAGYYEITAQDGTYWTLDRSAGTTSSSGGTYAMGGALATPGAAGVAMVSANKMWIGGGTYTLSTGTAGKGGPVQPGNFTFTIMGYSSSRDDLDDTTALSSNPVIDAGSVTGISGGIIDFNNQTNGARSPTIVNVTVDGNSGSGNRGMDLGSSNNGTAIRCLARDCPEYGFNSGVSTKSVATGCGQGFKSVMCQICRASGCSVAGFEDVVASNCIAYENAKGFRQASNTAGPEWSLCIAVDNTDDGFALDSGSRAVLMSCISCYNGGYGFDPGSVCRLIGCIDIGNTSGRLDSVHLDIGPVTLTADPFVDRSADDYNINNVAGGGAVIRAIVVDL